ncbi:MAG: hypothetical protein JSV18_08430 [Candidatus Bathyarchaeota archaeon]|nr:MAG: hypothetical protein JSV18_08430 [Candidatus Bathyarchaeota archaeon]
MPAQATNYFYTILAMGVVALMITNAFGLHASSLKAMSERRELKEILVSVAAEVTELAALTEATNASAKVCLHMPLLIGDKSYWIRLASDADDAWVEGAFGDPWTGQPDHRVELPWNVSVSGTYKGGYGTLALNCTIQGSGLALTLGRWEGG